MTWRCTSAAAVALVLSLGSASAQTRADRPLSDDGGHGALPSSTLAVRDGSAWRVWWRSDRAPVEWRDAPLGQAVRWHPGAQGIAWGEVSLAGSGEAWRTRVILARLDPRRLRLALDTAFTSSMRAAWTLGHVPTDAVFAVNAGQFLEAMPWGWVVLRGHEFLAPGRGPLAVAIVGDSSGNVQWLSADSVAAARPQRVAWAFESYPALLNDGAVPPALQASGRGVDLAHRDARLAIGRLPSGELMVALTRFDALGEGLGAIPFGFTVPEMTALMGALGCRDAVLLDGGISAQMMLRDANGERRQWRGVREVPLALLAYPIERRE